MYYTPIILTTLIFLANLFSLHFFTKKACLICSPFRRFITPFLMGGFSVLLFVLIFPFLLAVDGHNRYDSWIFLSLAIGFFVFLLLEVFVYRKVSREKLPKDLQIVHLALLFMLNLLVGLLVQNLFRLDLLLTVVFTVAFVLLTQTHKHGFHLLNDEELDFWYILAALAAPIGAIIGLYVSVSSDLLKPFVAFLCGWVLFALIIEIYENDSESSSLFIGILSGFIIVYLLI